MPTKPIAKNPYGKTRPVDNPYAVYATGGWEWRILKMNQRTDKTGKYSSAMCAVSSPYTHGSFDMGDTYLRDIVGEHQSGPNILAECGLR